MGQKSDKDNDAKPPADAKMGANATNPALTNIICLLGMSPLKVVYVLL